MPSTSEVRSWLRDNGYAPPAKGIIPADLQGAYDATHPAANGTTTMTADYPDEDFGTAFADPPPAPEDTGETKPRKPRAARAGGSGKGRFGFGRKASTGKAKKKPRVSTEDLLGSVWRGMAKLATPLPPLQRTLRVQAPVARTPPRGCGEGHRHRRDTPAVRAAREPGQDRLGFGRGPPVLVQWMTVHVQQRMQQDQAPNPLFMSVASEALRSALMHVDGRGGTKIRDRHATGTGIRREVRQICGRVHELAVLRARQYHG